MEELIAWMREQLDDDERVAREAFGKGSPRWSTETYDHGTEVNVRGGDGFCVIHSDGELDLAEAEHIARWDPARVLTEVDAKRRILDEIIQLHEREGRYTEGFLAALALPYADRPGYLTPCAHSHTP